MKFKETKIAALLVVVFVLIGSVYAEDLTVPHTFSPGTPAKSSEVNENFTTIYNAVNAFQVEFIRSSLLAAHNPFRFTVT